MSQKLCFSQELGEEVKFKKGDVVILTNEKELQDKCDRSVLYINSQYYLNQAKIGHKIWVGDGLLSFVVKEKCMFFLWLLNTFGLSVLKVLFINDVTHRTLRVK